MKLTSHYKIVFLGFLDSVGTPFIKVIQVLKYFGFQSIGGPELEPGMLANGVGHLFGCLRGEANFKRRRFKHPLGTHAFKKLVPEKREVITGLVSGLPSIVPANSENQNVIIKITLNFNALLGIYKSVQVS